MAGGKRRGQCLVGADLTDAVVRLLPDIADNFPKGRSKARELHTAQADCEVQTNSKKHRQHDRAKQECAQIPQNFPDDSFHFFSPFPEKSTGDSINESPVLRFCSCDIMKQSNA